MRENYPSKKDHLHSKETSIEREKRELEGFKKKGDEYLTNSRRAQLLSTSISRKGKSPRDALGTGEAKGRGGKGREEKRGE